MHRHEKPRNHPGHLKALLGLWLALDGLSELEATADALDPQDVAEGILGHTEGLRYVLAMTLADLDGDAWPLTGAAEVSLRELQELVNEGEARFPPAEALARAILDLTADADEPIMRGAAD